MTNPTFPAPPPRRAPQPKSQRKTWLIGGAVVAVFALLWVIGTVSKRDEPAEASPSTSSSSSAPAAPIAPPPAPVCAGQREITDPDLAAFANSLTLPAGMRVVMGRVSTDSDHPGKVGVALDLCAPNSTSVDALRPVATTIAAAMKSTDLGARTFALYVADISPDYRTEAKVKDPDYHLHLWNGQPSAAAELARWVIVAGR